MRKNPKQEKHENLKDKVEIVHIGNEIKKNQMEYSNLLIEERSIPSLYDGLKPVHRRILYSFKHGNFLGKFHKSAKIVGHTMGSFHPHGDTSIYDTLVDLTEPFKNRFPLTIGQGNWGTIEGDSQAAMRYTEVKFPTSSEEILFENLNKDDVVKWSKNYDDSIYEPDLLPTQYPICILNGTFGVAYANITTNIPSYNIIELTNLYIYLLENKFWNKFDINKHKENILKIISSVDFATGCNIYLDNNIKKEDIIFKPEFKINMRASYELDEKNKQIIFTNIPFGITAGKIKEQATLAGLSYTIKNGKEISKESGEILNISENIDIDSISSFNEEDFKNDVKLTFTFKKNSNLKLELIKIFKYTSLDLSFYAKLMFVDKYKKPVLKSLYEQSIEFLYFKLFNYYKAFQYDIKKLKENLHLLYALKTVHNDLDKFINIVKNNTNDKIYELTKKYFKLDDIQISYLLSIQLIKISKTSVENLIKEIKEKEIKINKLEKIISSKTNLANKLKRIYKNVLEKKLIPNKRNKKLTKIINIKNDIKNIKTEELVEDSEVIIIYDKEDNISFIDKSKFKLKTRTNKNINNKNSSDFEYNLKFSFECNLKDEILLFSNLGKVYKVKVVNLSKTSKFIGNIIKISNNEHIVYIENYNNNNRNYCIFTKFGKIKGLKNKIIKNITRPITNIKLEENDEVINIIPFNNKEGQILTITNFGRYLKYNLKELPVLDGGNTKGVKNVSLHNEEIVNNIFIINDEKDKLLLISENGKFKQIFIKDLILKKRAQSLTNLFNNTKNGNIKFSIVSNEKKEKILILTNDLKEVYYFNINNFEIEKDINKIDNYFKILPKLEKFSNINIINKNNLSDNQIELLNN